MPEPPASAVGSLVQRNSINPGLEARLAVKMLHSPKDLQKHFLGRVSRIGWIRHTPINQAIDRLVELADQPSLGVLRPSLQFGHDRGFLGPNSYRSSQFTQGGCSRHNSHGVTPNYRFFR